MGCCGDQASKSLALGPGPQAPSTVPSAASSVLFEYTGATRLVAEGPVTKRHYRFEHPGAAVEVDARDAPSIARIPLLRRRARSR